MTKATEAYYLLDALLRRKKGEHEMGDSCFQIVLYSTEHCEPCKALKFWFSEKAVPFQEVPKNTLSDAELQEVVKNILAVSRIDKPTVPAVRIITDSGDRWVSNHGESDVTEMIAVISSILEEFGFWD